MFKLYLETIKAIKNICLKDYILKPLNFNQSFELTTILLFCIFHGSNYNKNSKNKIVSQNQELMDLFVRDIDHSLRISGIGDMSIGKYVKTYIKKFYFRLTELEEIFTKKNKKIFYFKKYLIKYKIINSQISNILIIEFFDSLNNLFKRCKIQKINEYIYKDLFI